MINLPEEIQKHYEQNVRYFEHSLNELRLQLNVSRKEFLETPFQPLKNGSNKDDVSTFIAQFIPFLDYLIFVHNDDEILKKLSDLGFIKTYFKYMVTIDDVENEIRRLTSIKGLFILPDDFLVASVYILQLNFKINLIESFGLNTIYNKGDTNTLFVDATNRLRRYDYNSEKSPKSNLSDFEVMMNQQLHIFEKQSRELGLGNDEINNTILKMLKGNVKVFTDLFVFYPCGISKRTAYSELFPLLKLIIKDKKLFSETEFYIDDHDKSYDGNYKTYKSKIVEKFLLKK